MEIDLNNKISNDQKIYLLYYSKERGMCFSEGKVEKEYEKNKSLISHSCENKSEGILINESNNKIIGINIMDSRFYKEKGIFLNEAIEEFKNSINNQKENDKGRTIIQRITSYDELEKYYHFDGYELYSNKEYTISEAYSKISGKLFTVKKYYYFSKKYFHLIKEEQVAFSKIRNDFVIKLKDYYLSENISVLFFDKFLENRVKNFKKIYPLNIIKKVLIQINEIIKELDKYHINDIIFSPENLIFYNGNLKLINLILFIN